MSVKLKSGYPRLSKGSHIGMWHGPIQKRRKKHLLELWWLSELASSKLIWSGTGSTTRCGGGWLFLWGIEDTWDWFLWVWAQVQKQFKTNLPNIQSLGWLPLEKYVALGGLHKVVRIRPFHLCSSGLITHGSGPWNRDKVDRHITLFRSMETSLDIG